MNLSDPWHCSWCDFTHENFEKVAEHKNDEHRGKENKRVRLTVLNAKAKWLRARHPSSVILSHAQGGVRKSCKNKAWTESKATTARAVATSSSTKRSRKRLIGLWSFHGLHRSVAKHIVCVMNEYITELLLT